MKWTPTCLAVPSCMRYHYSQLAAHEWCTPTCRNDCIYTFSMDGVEGAGPLPTGANARAGRARPDQSYLDAGADLRVMSRQAAHVDCLALLATESSLGSQSL